MNWRSIVVGLVVALASGGPLARGGQVRTADGKVYRGRVKLEAGKIVVEPDAGPIVRLEAGDIVLATFDPPGTAAAAVARVDVQGLRGQYFSDLSLTRLAYTRVDSAVDFDWTAAPPDPVVPAVFSARWVGQLLPAFSDRYTFTVSAGAGGGVRLWVDGKPVIDNWAPPRPGPQSGVVVLHGKKADVRLEYFHPAGEPKLQLLWACPRQPQEVIPAERLFPSEETVTGLRGDYFSDKEMTHRLVARIDPQVSFSWPDEDHGPDPRVPASFATRWTGRLTPLATADYRIRVRGTDGVRLWIDGRQVVDDWPTGAKKDVTVSGAKNDAGGRNEPAGKGRIDHAVKLNLTANHAYPVKLEVYTAGKSPGTAELNWSAGGAAPGTESGKSVAVPGGLLSPPPDMADLGPAVAFVSRIGDAPLAAGTPSLTIEADAFPRRAIFPIGQPPYGQPPNGQQPIGQQPDGRTGGAQPANSPVTKVEFFAGRIPLGTAATRPYRVEWKAPPTGETVITAIATDASGIGGAAQVRVLVSADAGPPLPAPWCLAKVGGAEGEGRVEFENGAFTLHGGRSTLAAREDAVFLVCAPLPGDGQVVAHVGSMRSTLGPARAGVMLRTTLRPDAVSIAVMAATDPATATLVRRRPGAAAALSPAAGGPPCWLRLTRRGDAVAADVSPDRSTWTPLGASKLPAGSSAFAGFFVAGRDAGSQCTASFDHVSIGDGAAPMAYAAGGVLLKDGSFLPGEVRGLDDLKMRFARAGGAEQTIPAADVARVIFHPMTPEQAAALPTGKTGVLLSGGDFLEAEVQSIDGGAVTTNSVLFGLGRHDVHAPTLLAAVLHDPEATRPPFEVRLTDGADLRCATITVAKDHLQADAGPAGQLDVPAASVCEVRRGG